MALKEIIWMGNSKKNLIEFPEEVKDEIGYALHLAQQGKAHPNAKPIKLGIKLCQKIKNIKKAVAMFLKILS